MAATVFEKLAAGVRRNAWWVGPQVAVGVALGVAVGYQIAWLVYVAINTAGVWVYSDSYGPQRLRRQFWMKALAIPMLPVGLLGFLASDGGTTPRESAGGASDDEGVRKAVAGVPGLPGGGLP